MYVSAPHLSVSLPLPHRVKKCRALNFGISLLHLQRHISTQDAVNGAGIKIQTRRSLNSVVKRKKKEHLKDANKSWEPTWEMYTICC